MNNSIVYKIKPVFSDNRGNILDVLEDKVQHIGIVTFVKKGIIRGNHYHKKSTQFTYVLSGRVKMTTLNLKGSERKTFIMQKGSFARVPPNIVHIYESLSKAEVLDMTTESRKSRGYEKDTIRVNMK